MNSTTTYKRTMFGLSEINADIINCNDVTLSGSLKTNLITSTAAGQSLSVDALGTGSLNLNSGGVTKLALTNTESTFTSQNVRIRDGKTLFINNTANTQNFSIGMTGGATSNIYFNMTSLTNVYTFAIGLVEKFRIGTSQINCNVFLIIPTEVVGSNNTRAANTAFVTTATLGLTGITYSDVGSIDMTTIDNNVTISTGKVLTIGTIANAQTELLKVSAMDYSDPDYTTFVYSILQCDNTFTLPSYPDVKITLDNLSIAAQVVTGITYSNAGGIDMTTISNNLTIGAGKVLSIPNFSNVETTLTTFNTNLTGITYSAPFPLFIPKTTIAHDLEIATGKMITSDEMWCKLYSTHDLTDTIGVGYFKSFFYNNGSIGYISTENPVDIYDGTGTEIRIKVSTQEIGFTIDGLCLFNSSITLCDDIELPAYPSLVGTLDSLTESTTGITYLTTLDKTTISNNLEVGTGKVLAIPNYPNVESTLTSLSNSVTSLTNSVNSLTIKKYEDDFLDGFNTCPIPWTSTGTGAVAVTTDEPGHVGNVRMVASNDRILYPTSTNIRFYWEYFVKMEFCIKTQIVVGNANHDFIVGLSDNNGMSNDTILWSYTAAAGQWEMIVNGFAYQNAPGVSLSNDDYFYGFIESQPALGNKVVRFYLKNLNTNEVRDWSSVTNITTIDLAATYRPFFRVRNTDGVGTKSMFIDYVSIQHLKF